MPSKQSPGGQDVTTEAWAVESDGGGVARVEVGTWDNIGTEWLQADVTDLIEDPDARPHYTVTERTEGGR